MKQYDVFISYNREDDIKNKISNFINELRYEYKAETNSILKIFQDKRSIELGEQWKKKIDHALNNSNILLAFLSPLYFDSKYCCYEWNLFQGISKNNRIIPIKFRNFEKLFKLGTVNNLPQEGKELIEKAQKLQMMMNENEYDSHQTMIEFNSDQSIKKLVATFERLLFPINQDFTPIIEERECPPINPHVDEIQKSFSIPKEQPEPQNINIINTEIEEIVNDENESDSFFLKLDSFLENNNELCRKYPSKEFKPVAIIYTGGTVGMIKVQSGKDDTKSKLITAPVDKMLKNEQMLNSLKRLKVDMDFYSYNKPLDSSNIDSNDWIILAKIIKNLYTYYQGFVILHGTDTMVYTASALSFIFDKLDKPVILTGAEKPLEELGNDAVDNTCNAIKTAINMGYGTTVKIPEVCILFGNKILRGNRSKKMVSLHLRNGFDSKNCNPIGTIDDIIEVNKREIFHTKTRQDSMLEIDTRISRKKNVIIFSIYPDSPYELYIPIFMDDSIDGIILKTYGTGNAPTSDSFLQLINKALKRGKIIVNVTQCPEGKVEVRLFETNARLFDYGVISGGDMTPEAAYCKLKYLLGIYQHKHDDIKRLMQQDLRGELTYSSHSFLYNKQDTNKATPFFDGEKQPFVWLENQQIHSAFIRIQGVKNLYEEQSNINLKLFINHPNIKDHDNSNTYELGEINYNLEEGNEFIQNIDATQKVKELIRERTSRIDIALQIYSTNKHVAFDALELIIYTKRI